MNKQINFIFYHLFSILSITLLIWSLNAAHAMAQVKPVDQLLQHIRESSVLDTSCLQQFEISLTERFSLDELEDIAVYLNNKIASLPASSQNLYANLSREKFQAMPKNIQNFFSLLGEFIDEQNSQLSQHQALRKPMLTPPSYPENISDTPYIPLQGEDTLRLPCCADCIQIGTQDNPPEISEDCERCLSDVGCCFIECGCFLSCKERTGVFLIWASIEAGLVACAACGVITSYWPICLPIVSIFGYYCYRWQEDHVRKDPLPQWYDVQALSEKESRFSRYLARMRAQKYPIVCCHTCFF